MRSRRFDYILAGVLSIGMLACHPPAPPPTARAPIEPPVGWRMGHQRPRPDMYSASFVPKQRVSEEKMWITILRKPEFLSKSADELLQVFQPEFICQSRDLNVLKKTENEVVCEETDSVCYGRGYKYTMGRIAKGRASVSYYAYRSDAQQVPADHRDFILKTLTSAPLDISGSAAATSHTSTAAGAGAASE
jgi:hypothetical protein